MKNNKSTLISGACEREKSTTWLQAQLARGDRRRRLRLESDGHPRLRRRNLGNVAQRLRNLRSAATMPSTASDERVPGESDDEELPPAAGPSAPGPSFLDATDTTVIRIDDSPLVLPLSLIHI